MFCLATRHHRLPYPDPGRRTPPIGPINRQADASDRPYGVIRGAAVIAHRSSFVVPPTVAESATPPRAVGPAACRCSQRLHRLRIAAGRSASLPGSACTVRSSVATMLHPSFTTRCLPPRWYVRLPLRRSPLLPAAPKRACLPSSSALTGTGPRVAGVRLVRFAVERDRFEVDRVDFQPCRVRLADRQPLRADAHPRRQRLERRPRQLLVVAHLEELRRREEAPAPPACVWSCAAQAHLLIVKRRAPAGAARPNREISRSSGTTLCVTVSVPSGWSSTSAASSGAAPAASPAPLPRRQPRPPVARKVR